MSATRGWGGVGRPQLKRGLDKVALAASFKIVMLEGIEVVFIERWIGMRVRIDWVPRPHSME